MDMITWNTHTVEASAVYEASSKNLHNPNIRFTKNPTTRPTCMRRLRAITDQPSSKYRNAAVLTKR